MSNILSVFERVATVTNEKIDKVLDDVRAFPQSLPNIPGMDLTAGGEYLTYEEALKLKAKQENIVKQSLALKSAFAHLNALLINKSVFYELTKELGLYRIYSTPIKSGVYRVRATSNESAFLQHLATLPVKREVVSELVKKTLFKDLEVSEERKGDTMFNFHANHIVEFKITVIPPPEPIRKKIVEIISSISENLHEIKICTVADERAFDVEIFSIEPLSLQPFDPGIVLERGDFAVILTDTFYHISDLEQQFLDKAEQIAEKWSVKRFLLN